MLVSDSKLKTLSKEQQRRAVKIGASVLTSDPFNERGQVQPDVNTLTRNAAKIAYEKAGIGPSDVGVAEVHDAFTIAELMYYEAFGWAKKGEAYRLLSSGATSLGGKIPVNPSGGLLSRGHPVGATGAAQAVEIVRQLEGRAGKHQVEGAKVGLTHATGGGIAGFDHGACSIHIFSR